MSLFQNLDYQWRETYFVMFASEKRPTLAKVQRMLQKINPAFALSNLVADEQGRFVSLTLISLDDFAAMDICYLEGDEVREEGKELAMQISENECNPEAREKLRELLKFDARFDVFHFEQVVKSSEEEEDEDQLLDPGTLLLVLEALAKMTDGIVIDPQSGTFA